VLFRSEKNQKVLRGKENISLYTLKNNIIGDPTNIEKECRLKSYSDFLTCINQICTNARKYYGVHSMMYQASQELLNNAIEEVHNSRDNLLYRLKNEKIQYVRCRGQAIGERAESEAINRLMGVYGGGNGTIPVVADLTVDNVLDYECVKYLVEDQFSGESNSGTSSSSSSSSNNSSSNGRRNATLGNNYLEWIPRIKSNYPRMMKLTKLKVKAKFSA
jgi:hypothetical protein